MTAILSLCLLLVGPALAGKGSVPEVAQAEVQRLGDELRRKVGENAWAGADDQYRRLLLLDGAELTYELHWLGYLAAQGLGEANAQHQRLQVARAVRVTPELLAAEARLLAWYGEVEIVLAKGLEAPPVLGMDEVPFDADQRRVLEAANAALTSEGRYQGLLPLGQFHLGEIRFEIIGEPEPVKVKAGR